MMQIHQWAPTTSTWSVVGHVFDREAALKQIATFRKWDKKHGFYQRYRIRLHEVTK